jgi:hypothetical protein
MTLEQLKLVHGLLDGQDKEKWIQAASLILADRGVEGVVDSFELADKIVREFLHDLLEADDYAGAAALLWHEQKFNMGPKFVQDVMRVIHDHHLVLLQGASSTSKTLTAAMWMFLDWLREPNLTSVKIISRDEGHLRGNAFGAIRTAFHTMAIPWADMDDIVDRDSDLYLGMRSAGKEFGFQGIAFKQSYETTGALQGYHPRPYRKFDHPKFGRLSRIRILGDECSDWPEGPFGGLSSPMSSIDAVGHVKLVLTFNPVSVDKKVMEWAMPEQGWLLEDCERLYEWTSKKGWHVLRLDGKLCENVVERKDIYPGFVNYEGYMQKLQGEGDSSSEFYAFGRGWPPLKTQVWTVFPPAWPTLQRGEALFDELICNWCSIDCAYQGIDKVVMTVGRFGFASGWTKANGETVKFPDPSNPKVYKSRPVLQADQQIMLEKSDNTVTLALEIKGKCMMMGIEPKWVVVDGTGQGAGTADNLRTYWGDVLILRWGEGATKQKVLAEDKQTAAERYDGVVTEIWFAAKEWMNPEVCAFLINPIISSNPITTQLTTRRFRYVKGGKVRIEAKEEWKARNSGKSPDEAESLLMAQQLMRQRASVLPGMATMQDNRPKKEEEAANTVIDSTTPQRKTLEWGGEDKNAGEGLRL